MEKSNTITSLSNAQLLELSMSIGKFGHLKEDIKSFTSTLLDLFEFDACELWIKNEHPNDENISQFYKTSQQHLFKHSTYPTNSLILKPNKSFFSKTIITSGDKGIYAEIITLKYGSIYQFQCSEKIYLFAYSTQTELSTADASLHVLHPFLNRFANSISSFSLSYPNQDFKEPSLDTTIIKDLNQYKLILDNGFDGILNYDLTNKKLLSANNKLLDIFGYTLTEFLNIPIKKSAPEYQANGMRSVDYLKKINLSVLEKGKVNYDWIHLKKDGALVHVEVVALRFKTDDRYIKIEIHKDVTDRYIARQIIIENEKRLATLFEHSPVALLIRSLNNLEFKLINKKFSDLFGYQLEELNTLDRSKLVYSEDKDFIDAKMKQLIAGEILDFELEKQYIRKDGSIFWGRATRSLVTFQNETFLLGFVEDISSRKKTRAALIESKAKVRAIFDSTTDKIFAIDKQFKLVDLNKAAQSYINDVFGKNTFKINDYFLSQDKDIKKEWIRYFSKALRGKSLTITKNYIRKNEEKVDLINIHPIKDDNKNIIGITIYAKDITELINTQSALQKRESQLKEAQRMAKNGNWEYDIINNKLEWSDGLFLIYEMDPKSSPIGFEDYKKIIHPDDIKEHLRTIKNILETGKACELENRKITKSGRIIHTFSKVEAIVEKGKVVKLYGTIQDITEQKKAQEKLIESNLRYEDLFNNMYDAFVIIDENGYLKTTNDAMQRLTEYSQKELKEIKIKDIVYKEDIKKSAKYLEQLYSEGFYTNYQGRIVTKSGKVKYIQVSSNAIIKDGKFVGSRDIIRDISELKEAEIKREQLYQELTIANKELKDFAYIVSHDLKAPLRAISSLSSWIAEDYGALFDEEGKKHLELLIGRSNRMQNFIEGILEYSRLGKASFEKQLVNINLLIHDVIKSLQIPQNFIFNIDDDIPLIVCEKIRMQQVFQNLISNAIKYNDKEKGIIKISYKELGNYHKFFISDNGIGIDSRHFDRIFQIFQTLQSRDDLENTGIGLTVVKRIIELHEGSIEVDSTIQEGSTFSFTILKLKLDA